MECKQCGRKLGGGTLIEELCEECRNRPEMEQARIPSLTETLFDLEKFMTGEARNGLPDSADVIISLVLIQGKLMFTTCTGIWRFDKQQNGIESCIVLEARPF
jgi:hypothetical protein